MKILWRPLKIINLKVRDLATLILTSRGQTFAIQRHTRLSELDEQEEEK